MPLAYFHPYPYHFEAVKFCVELGYSYTCDDATCLALHALIFQLSKHVQNCPKVSSTSHPGTAESIVCGTWFRAKFCGSRCYPLGHNLWSRPIGWCTWLDLYPPCKEPMVESFIKSFRDMWYLKKWGAYADVWPFSTRSCSKPPFLGGVLLTSLAMQQTVVNRKPKQ